MVAQTSMTPTTDTNGQQMRVDSPFADGVIGNLAELGTNIATLAELQTQLAIADMKESARQATAPAVLIGAGVVLLFAGLPVALIGGAELLADWMQLTHRGFAYMIVAGVTFALVGVLLAIGLPRFSRSFVAMGRSQEELARNVAWIKRVIANTGRKPGSSRGTGDR